MQIHEKQCHRPSGCFSVKNCHMPIRQTSPNPSNHYKYALAALIAVQMAVVYP